MHNRIVTLAVVIGLLVGAAGVGLLIATDDDEGTAVDAGLPKLPMGAYGERTAAAGAADMMLAGPVEWRVRGDLPDLPGYATAYRLAREVDPQRIVRLVEALGLDDDDPELGVAGNGDWYHSTEGDCPEPRVGEADGCAGDSVSSSIAAPCPADGKCESPGPP